MKLNGKWAQMREYKTRLFADFELGGLKAKAALPMSKLAPLIGDQLFLYD